MGGRGASSGGGGGLAGIKSTFAVSDQDGNDMGLIIEANGKTFWQNARGRISELPDNVTAKEYVDRVTKNGGAAKKLSKADLAKKDAEHKAYRKAMDAFLNNADVTDKTMKKGTKANRTSSAVARRPRG